MSQPTLPKSVRQPFGELLVVTLERARKTRTC